MIILIDDERSFIEEPEGAVVLRTSEAALEFLATLDTDTIIDQLWFDHDLGVVDGEKDTTIPVLRKLEELCFFDEAPVIKQVIVHTSNPVGGKEIYESMKRYFPTARVMAGDYLIVR